MITRLLAAAALLWLIVPTASANSAHCGKAGVWVEILGAGSGELDDAQGGPSYLVWIDNQAKLLINAGPGALLRFEESGAQLADLDAVVFNQLGATHTSDFAAFVAGARPEDRRASLPVFGPEAGGGHPGLNTWIDRLFGAEGVYPELGAALDGDSNAAMQLEPETLRVIGAQRWSSFGTDNLELSAIRVNHGDVPSIAWRVDTPGGSVVFAGSFNNQSNRLAAFANAADTIVFHHAIPQSARGRDRDFHVVPGQIGRISENAEIRFVILGHRASRTRGVETLTRQSIEENFKGDLIFANDSECWGL